MNILILHSRTPFRASSETILFSINPLSPWNCSDSDCYIPSENAYRRLAMMDVARFSPERRRRLFCRERLFDLLITQGRRIDIRDFTSDAFGGSSVVLDGNHDIVIAALTAPQILQTARLDPGMPWLPTSSSRLSCRAERGLRRSSYPAGPSTTKCSSISSSGFVCGFLRMPDCSPSRLGCSSRCHRLVDQATSAVGMF